MESDGPRQPSGTETRNPGAPPEGLRVFCASPDPVSLARVQPALLSRLIRWQGVCYDDPIMRDRDQKPNTDLMAVNDRCRGLLHPPDQQAMVGVASILLLVLACFMALPHLTGAGWVHRRSLTPRAVTFQVDINRADWPELAALPEVGESLAREIIAYRKQHGPFCCLAELAMINGIGTMTLQRISPYVPLPHDRGSGVMAKNSLTHAGPSH